MTARASHPQPASGTKPLVAISMGDPAGIGAEVIVKALQDPALRALGRFVLYGLEDVFASAADAAGIKPYWFEVSADEAARMDSGVVVVDVEQTSAGFWVNARPTAEGGRLSMTFLERAIDAVRGGPAEALVTGPIHKVSWQLAGVPYPGHTEKLAAAFGCDRVTMAFVAEGMRVALASAHLGLFELRNHFTIGLVFQPIDLLHQALVDWFGIARPRIAVAGLNPHAGEEGRFGDEEQRVIEPAMQIARTHGMEVDGPFPADTLFVPHRRARYDGIVVMYHDQGLIPIKALAFHSAVNMTLGLPVVRTSPDHGTAFDIAGTNAADPGSMKSAIRLACELAIRRRDALARRTAETPAPACQP